MPSHAFARSLFPAGLVLAASLTFAGQARADDVAVVEQKLRALESTPASPAAEAISRAREALGRARTFRNAGDELHAKVAIALAQDWTLTAEDISRAATMERDAAAAAKEADDAQKRIAREEAQLEEQLVRGARLRASVEAREKEVVGRPRAEPDLKAGKGGTAKDAKGAKDAKTGKDGKGGKGGPQKPPKKPTEMKGEAP